MPFIEGGPWPGHPDGSPRRNNLSPELDRQEPGLEAEDDSTMLLPVKVVAKEVGLSRVRIRHLLKEGKIEGELHEDEGYGKGLWYTSVEAVEKYKQNLWTSREWGRKGGLIAGRGRPKSSEKQG